MTRGRARALAALVMTCLVAGAPSLLTRAHAQAGGSSTTPAVTIGVTPAQNPLASQITLTADSPLQSSSIDSIDFQSSPEGTGDWTSLGKNPSGGGGLPPYTIQVTTPSNVPDGLYDLRAVLTETGGATDVSPTLRDQLVANDSPVVVLSRPSGTLQHGSPLRGTIPLRAVQAAGYGNTSVATISFQASPGDADHWSSITTTAADASGAANASLDTTQLPDGFYDLRAVPFDAAHQAYATIPIRGVIVDNTPPSITLGDPGSSLSGTVKLAAQAADAGSGVSSVQFQAARAGTGAWHRIGQSSHPPYDDSLDTATLDNGSWDFRALATDRAGNLAISNVVTATIANQDVAAPAPQTFIQGVSVPAHNVTMLGTIANSSTHETWAYGFTGAPPATVDGSRLPYVAQGDQFVLLRYTDVDGWQIADVLRNADGSAFPLLPASDAGTDPVLATGRMTPSGEAWLWINEPSTNSAVAPVRGLFHRSPGGAFRYDAAATQSVGARLLAALAPPASGQLRIGEAAGGGVYGLLTASGQQARSMTLPAPDGSNVTVDSQLDYATLSNGSWTTHTAQPPASYAPRSGDLVKLAFADADGADSGWGALAVQRPIGRSAPLGLQLAHFAGGNWSYTATGLDALDLTGSVANAAGSVTPLGLKADTSGVWIRAQVALPTAGHGGGGGEVVAHYSADGGSVSGSWCTLPVANSCSQPLDTGHPAAVPDAVFGNGNGNGAGVALQHNALDVFSRGQWGEVPAAGFTTDGGVALDGPSTGWLGGRNAVGQVSVGAPAGPLTSWPIAVRAPLTSVALPPGGTADTGETGALAVGLNGSALEYQAGSGWIVTPTPQRVHHIHLHAVAFNGPSSAYAVGQFGVLLHWDGTSWTEDPQSISLTQFQLNSVAFDGSGQGWAVGAHGSILHFDGTSWTVEQPPADAATTDITSVTVAGSDVLAVAGGNLIERRGDGSWQDARSLLPNDPAPLPGHLRLVAGLPDGGAVIAGRSIVLVRQGAGTPFRYSDQPLEGIAVALAPFRDGGVVRAAVSLAPPAASPLPPFAPTDDIGGFPAGDGELMIETARGWNDLSRSAHPGTAGDLAPDGQLKPDPVLAVATSPDGRHAWAVGGYAGTPDGGGLGSSAILAARPAGWQTASLWRYDAGGSATSPALSSTTPSLPATPGTVSFAFFSSPLCRVQCSTTLDAQPDTNLAGAVSEISAYAGQPGGPAFAMLGGNARGPSDSAAWGAGNGEFDFAELPGLLQPLSVPLFAAAGPLDAVPTEQDPYRSWSDAFAGAPRPFGSGGTAPGITPVSSGSGDGSVSRYYAFDASQNGGTVRVIVLDNSKGSLDASDAGQSSWLGRQLGDAGNAGVPVVVVAAQSLRSTADGAQVAATLVNAGVLAVFTSDGTEQLNQVHQIPDGAATTIPEYEGASLGYQQPANDGVSWYDVSVDTQGGGVSVNAVPVIDSLALQPLTGLTAARSSTLQFQAIARRPRGSLATAPKYSDTAAGYDNYLAIPAPSCGANPCVTPTYAFTSSDPTIGTFVTASGPGSPYPKLNGKGKPIANSKSGLFCAFNPGTTTVSVTAGDLSYSLDVTVQPGGFGPPCGTVPPAGAGASKKSPRPGHATGAGAGVPPPLAPATSAPAHIAVKIPPAPHPVAAAHAAPHVAAAPAVAPSPVPAAPTVAPILPPAVALAPPPPTAVEPIPPGGATAQAAAQRREKARKHASQTAFTTLAPRTRGYGWYEGILGATALLAAALAGTGLRRRKPMGAPNGAAQPAAAWSASRRSARAGARRRRG